MKTRILKTIGLVAAMVACVGMTVFAEPSPSASTVVTGATAKDNLGNDAWVVIEEIKEEDKAVVANIKTEEGFKSTLAQVGIAFDENLVVADVVEVRVESINGGRVEFPVTITFNVKGVTTSTKGYILHWTGTAWEKIPTTIGEGTMTGTFNTLSPVAFVIDKTTLSSGTATSPQTSASATAGAAVLGLTAVAGICGLKKKRF